MGFGVDQKVKTSDRIYTYIRELFRLDIKKATHIIVCKRTEESKTKI